MLPVMVPNVQTKLLGALDVKVIFGPVPLQVIAVAAFVIAGIGLTDTVKVKGDPTHDPVVDVGVIIYGTVPAVALPGFVSV
jgi:hypothetical protein